MLILSRKPGDSILIGDGIRLVVIECDRKGVRLGIEAPAEVNILRGEIVNQIAEENRRAGATPPPDWLDVLPVRAPPS
ncbi:MAG TPA: carbon storage regulator CsrA [Longimicrobiaceae bacterium]|nr:carbon storage regulator CsrA [Longimicrobiaceae bacterium]